MRPSTVGVALACSIGLVACAQDPYTAEDGRADLVEAGYSDAAADCVIDGLDAYFREEFLALQASEGIEPDVVPKRQADIYVKNRFSGTTEIPADLDDEAKRLISTCSDEGP